MKSIFHSKAAQALSAWVTLLTAVYAGLTKFTPDWFGKLSWTQAVLLGMAAALVTTLLAALAFYLGVQAYRLWKPVAGASTIRPPHGDTLSASGTVTDASRADQLARGLYVGRMEIDVRRLKSDHLVEIAIIGFNGTNHVVSFSRATGSVTLSLSGSDASAPRFALSLPSILAERSNPDAFPDHAEFMLVFEQTLKPNVVEWLEGQMRDNRILFDLDELDVIMEVRGEGISTCLPLWNGATVHFEEGYRTGKLARLEAHSSASIG